MKPGKLAVLAVALGVGLSACSDVNAPSPTAPARPHLSIQSRAPLAGVDRSRLRLPAGGRISDHALPDLTRRAINPDELVCPASTPITDWWLNEAFAFIDAEPEIFDLVYDSLAADLVVTYEALYFQTTATPQYFGYNGEFTKAINKAERDVKRFWDIDSDGIQVIGMHGRMLQDEARVAATYEYVFGIPAPLAAEFASEMHDAIAASDVLNGGDHSLFSFNAFALSLPDGSLPDKIVMGDGMLAGYQALGFGDVAPQAVFAHEFAHHIQYQNGYFEEAVPGATTDAELTRYTELMADAYSAYYLTHKRGGAMNKKRVAQFLEAFYEIGDCAFTDPGHHGTPNQRMRAAEFGFSVADQAQKQGHILTSEQFHALFVAAYPSFVAPDAH